MHVCMHACCSYSVLLLAGQACDQSLQLFSDHHSVGYMLDEGMAIVLSRSQHAVSVQVVFVQFGHWAIEPRDISGV